MGLVVSISDKNPKIISEMVDEPEVGIIAEQITDPTKLDAFCPGWSTKGAALVQAAEDDKPHFTVVRVEEGWSNNKRLWDADEIRSIAEQTNRLEPVGHLGHIPDEQASYAMPDPQTTWFGATTKVEPSQDKSRVGEMVTVGYFAGYNLPGAKVRTYIRTRAVRGISWWGSGNQVPVPGKGVQVRGFVLKALDWARKGSEGMPTARVVANVSEMEGDKMDKALSQVTPEEFKKENPNGYALLVAEATAEKDAKIGEMEEKVQEGEKAKSLLTKACELLGISEPEKIEEQITVLKSKVGEKAKATVQDALAKLAKEKIPGDDNDEAVKTKRAMFLRLVPQAEMEQKVSDTKPDEAEKLIGEMLNEAIDKDDLLKATIGEMQPPVVRRREELRNGGGSDNTGVKRERVTL